MIDCMRKFFQKSKKEEMKQQIPELEVDKHHEGDAGCSGMIIHPNTHSKNLSTLSFHSSPTGSHPNVSPIDPNNSFLIVQQYSSGRTHTVRAAFHRTLTILKNFKEFTSRYKEKKTLGKGGFGHVYAGERRSDSKPVAIKHIPKKRVKFVRVNCQGNVYDEILEVVLMELAAGRLCNGSFENRAVIGLMETFELEREFLIVMERPPDTVDMIDYLKEVNCIPEGQAKVIFKQIVNAALLMHSNGVFHRDLKLDNFLVQRNQGTPQIRLIDFGCADFVLYEPFKSFCGTPDFAPPECFIGETYKAEACTVWQIGAMLHSICTSKGFNTEKFMEEKNKAPRNVSKECSDFLSRCLALDQNKRPTLKDLLLHPWLE